MNIVSYDAQVSDEVRSQLICKRQFLSSFLDQVQGFLRNCSEPHLHADASSLSSMSRLGVTRHR